MADVFLSYARADAAEAERLRDALQGLGLTIFFDTEGLDGGDVFPDVLDREVKTAGAVVGVWSRHALTRPWVKIECDIGRTRGVLVPVRVEDIPDLEIPAAFWNIQVDDLSGFDGRHDHAGWLRFIRALARTLDRPDLLAAESARALDRPEAADADVRAEIAALRAELEGMRAEAEAAPAKTVEVTKTVAPARPDGGGRARWMPLLAGFALAALALSAALVWLTRQPMDEASAYRWQTMNDHEWWTSEAADLVRRAEMETPMSELVDIAAGGDPAALALQGLAQMQSYHIAGGDAGARESFRLACQANHRPGCLYFATFLLAGRGGPRDAEAAAEMGQKLCADSVYPACAIIGHAHEHGDGAPRDIERARRFYQSGCDGGFYEACTRLQSMAPPAPPE